MTVSVNVSMKCNINNAGFITGTPAVFDIQYSTVPTAIAPSNQTVTKGRVVTLYGSATSNANTPITYAWTLTSKPAGSQAALSSMTTTTPTFTADVVGAYVVSLVVNDGTVNSAAATTNITAQ